MTDTESLNRLLQEQDVGIRKTEDEIAALIAFRADYQTLVKKLEDLPKAVSRPAIIPFGRKALVPGRLIHTNELLVHLGGSEEYFAELSAYETINLIKRRIERLGLSIEKLNDQRRLIHDRVKYTHEFAHQAPHVVTQPPSTDNEITKVQSCEQVEIRESYDSDTERDWKAKHRSAKIKERETLSKVPEPLLKRRVRFASEKTGEEEVEKSDESTASTSNSEYDVPIPESYIYFHHSPIPSLLPREDISDQSTMTIAEAVNCVNKYGSLFSPAPILDKPTAIFQDIVERDENMNSKDAEPSTKASAIPTQTTRVSRFRAERLRRK